MALGATSASAASAFPWPDLPVLYTVMRKAVPPAGKASAPQVASGATRARDTQDQGLVNAGGSGCSWDDGTCSPEYGPGEGWASFGSFEVVASTNQLTKVELWGKSEQRQAAVCSGLTCNVFGVPENISMDPTNPGPLIAFFGYRFSSQLLETCVRSRAYSYDADRAVKFLDSAESATQQLSGQVLVAGDSADFQYRNGDVYRFEVSLTNAGKVLLGKGYGKQTPSASTCAR